MTIRDGRRGVRLSTVAATTVGTVAVAAAGMAPAAHAAPFDFNGTYTAVQKSFTIDPNTGAQLDAPPQVMTWIVFSACALPGCVAHIVSNSLDALDMVFDGRQWNRVAIPPQTGNCGGAPVPARAAVQFLLPRVDGSLSGALNSIVDCGGAPVALSQPLTVTPS